ncbi:metallophosphoesterase 1-like [Tripterygium wilfordii]|uniref:Metallophosphoesterase 1-like n=1 Tax=Tripterygium wilfordii TaxID=458696 RepID=A0A7J7DKP9_TRIWF|nr:metallophosphoesterase 1-like [Tripterygium wilfordii]
MWKEKVHFQCPHSCDITHSDGAHEITVPAMTWKAKDDPGFLVATFRKDRKGDKMASCFSFLEMEPQQGSLVERPSSFAAKHK